MFGGSIIDMRLRMHKNLKDKIPKSQPVHSKLVKEMNKQHSKNACVWYHGQTFNI